MKKVTLCLPFLLGLSLLLMPGLSQADPPELDIDLGHLVCNWGILSMNAIVLNDFDQGVHSSNPPDSGVDLGRPGRAGLPNLAEALGLSDSPDLEALCEALAP